MKTINDIGISAGKKSLCFTRIKDAGLMVTNPRLQVMHFFYFDNNCACSALDIYKYLLMMDASFPLSTIYNVLNDFVAVGLLSSRYFADGIRYFEANNSDMVTSIILQPEL